MELSIVIPTRDRLPILRETLARLDGQRGDVAFEVVVVDDGSTDATVETVSRMAADAPFPLVVLRNPRSGPAAARNRGMEVARATVCLFINDDAWPQPGLLRRHAEFHRRRPEPESALLGRIALPADPSPSPFMRWLAEVHFDYGSIDDPNDAGGRHFYTGNVSVKRAFVQAAGGFDERFPLAAHEDIDLGLRLDEAGLRLAYDPEAVVEHFHPIDLDAAIARHRAIGRELRPFIVRHPRWPVARPPGVRHRLKAGALTTLAMTGVQPACAKRATWRFLVHEAAREGFWDEGTDARLRIGARLASIARRADAARMP